MSTEGLLTEVIIAERGSNAAAVAAVDATEILVADITDYTDYTADDTTDPETATVTGIGVVIDILGERYTVDTVTPGAADDAVAEGAGETYDLAAELTPGTLTLTEPLRVQVDEDDPVWVVVGDEVGTDAYALVSFPQTAEVLGEDTDAGDVAQVPIAYGQRASFPEGIYDPPAPIVVADDLSAVLDVPGTKPIIDGSTIINLPPPEDTTDGLPPAESPTPTVYSGLGSLQVRWPGIVNADPVKYRVYLSTLDQSPPPDGSMIAETSNTMITISTDSEGNRLVYDQPYFVTIEAFDADGAADPSPPVAGHVMQVTNEDVAAEFVYAGQIIANQIIGGEVTSPLVLASSIKTANEGARVEILGDGIAVYDSTGAAVAIIPTEGTAIFRGDAEIGDLTLVGGATLRGSTEVSRSAYIVLANKVSPSRSAPTLSNTWDSRPTDFRVPAPGPDEYPEEYATLPWVLQGVARDNAYTRYSWWGYVTRADGVREGLYFTSVNANAPISPRFEGWIWDDDMLALAYSGDSPAEANLPTNEPGFYYVTRDNDRIYLNWVPDGWDDDSSDVGDARPVVKSSSLPNVGNFKWAITNLVTEGSYAARIYGAVRNSNGTVAVNVWNPNTNSIVLAAITNPGAQSNWDSMWGRSYIAAGTGALVADGNYIKLTSTAAGKCGYSLGEKIDLPAAPGDRFTAANRIWPGTADLLGKTGYIEIWWFNSAGATISSVAEPFKFPNSTAWVTANVEGTAPAGTVRMSMRVYFTATRSGQVVYGGQTAISKAGGLSSPVETLTLNTGTAITELFGITVAKGDFPDYRILLLERTGSAATVRSFSLTGARQASEDFPLPSSGIASLYWNQDRQWWESVDDNGTTYKHEPDTKTYDRLHASFTWRRGSQYESAQSSVASITHKRRSKLVVTIPPKVITGAPDDPDSAGIYLGQGATVPTRTGMYLQAIIPDETLVITSPVWSTANPPDPNNNPHDFPAAIPGRVYSAAYDTLGPLIDLRGDGTWRIGNLSGTADGKMLDASGSGKVARLLKGNQSIPNTTETTVTWSGTRGAPYVAYTQWFTIASSVLTLKAGQDGVYDLTAFLYWENAGTAGTRRILAIDQSLAGSSTWYRVMRNDGVSKATASAASGIQVTASLPLSAGDRIQVVAYQDSGGALSQAAIGTPDGSTYGFLDIARRS